MRILKNHTVISTAGITNSTALMECWNDSADKLQGEHKKTPTQKSNFLLSRALLKGMLFFLTGEKDWTLVVDNNGRPYILNKNNDPGPHISISHTKGLVACAVSTAGEIGIDIEHWKVRDFKSISDFSFGPNEREYINAGGISEFYRIWTLREAISKATGEGLSLVTNGSDVVKGICEGTYTAEDFRFYCSELKNDYSLALALKNTDKSRSPEMINVIDSNTLLCDSSGINPQ